MEFETADGIECYKMEILQEGLEEALLFYITPSDLSMGDIVYYETDTDGMVKNYYKVYDYATKTYTNFNSIVAMAGKYETAQEGWNFDLYDDGHDIQLVYGVVAEVNGDNVTLAPIPFSGAAIDINFDVPSVGATLGGNTYALTGDAEVYVYDTGDTQSLREYDKLHANGNVIASNFLMFETAKNSKVYMATANGENRDNYANYALAMIVDGEIVEIYTINK